MPRDVTEQTRRGWLRILLIGRRPKTTLIRAGLLVAICFVVFRFILLPAQIQGISMLPTYRDRQINFVNRLAYLWHEPRRGDIVSVRFARPGGFALPSVVLTKRIIALPGETVSFQGGHAFINGKMFEESYVKGPCDWSAGPVTCGSTQYYVVGDNRSMPFEFHLQGRAERDRIIGKLLL